MDACGRASADVRQTQLTHRGRRDLSEAERAPAAGAAPDRIVLGPWEARVHRR